MVKHATAPIDLGRSWDREGSSLGLDTLSFFLALAMHVPLFYIKMEPHKKAIERPTERLVSVDLLDQVKPKEPEVVAPPPPVVKGPSIMEKLKMLVKKEPPPPPPPVVEPKPLPEKLLEAPKPLPLQAKLDMPQMVQPKLESKAGFQTKMDPAVIQNKQLAMQAPVPGIAPLSAQKLGTLDDRTAVKTNKGNFQMGKGDTLKGIGGDGPALSGATPVIAIKTGAKATTENFSAPVTQKTDKGRIGALPSAGLNTGPQMGLRDSIIARDAKPSQIAIGGAAGGQPGGATGGVPGGTGLKKDAGRSFQSAVPSGVGGPGVGGAANTAIPSVAALVPKKKEKQSMFTITGPLKDRKVEKQVAPEYPEWAQAQGISASVVLEFTVDTAGFVKNLVVVRRTSGYPKLDESAIKALRQWKFAPLPDGENRDEVGQVTVNFSLS